MIYDYNKKYKENIACRGYFYKHNDRYIKDNESTHEERDTINFWNRKRREKYDKRERGGKLKACK